MPFSVVCPTGDFETDMLSIAKEMIKIENGCANYEHIDNKPIRNYKERYFTSYDMSIIIYTKQLQFKLDLYKNGLIKALNSIDTKAPPKFNPELSKGAFTVLETYETAKDYSIIAETIVNNPEGTSYENLEWNKDPATRVIITEVPKNRDNKKVWYLSIPNDNTESILNSINFTNDSVLNNFAIIYDLSNVFKQNINRIENRLVSSDLNLNTPNIEYQCFMPEVHNGHIYRELYPVLYMGNACDEFNFKLLNIRTVIKFNYNIDSGENVLVNNIFYAGKDTLKHLMTDGVDNDTLKTYQKPLPKNIEEYVKDPVICAFTGVPVFESAYLVKIKGYYVISNKYGTDCCFTKHYLKNGLVFTKYNPTAVIPVNYISFRQFYLPSCDALERYFNIPNSISLIFHGLFRGGHNNSYVYNSFTMNNNNTIALKNENCLRLEHFLNYKKIIIGIPN